MDFRQRRKLEHVETVASSDEDGTAFDDISLIHNCLPELSVTQVDLRTELVGMPMAAPILINAITGGAQALTSINEAIAAVAAASGLPMAVGSQTAMLRDPTVRDTYLVVRDVNPEGMILANVSALAGVEDAVAAVELLRANALQVHLNPAQELIMEEGDRDFRGSLERIAAICERSPVPVIVKETGCGIAARQARALEAVGVAALDVGGRGGTSFIAVERRRRGLRDAGAFANWGLPTPVSLVETNVATEGRVPVVASGGLRSGVDVAKSLALGAVVGGIAAPCLRAVMTGGAPALQSLLNELVEQLRIAMVLAGAASPAALAARPVVILGRTADWLEQRGIDVTRYARRDLVGLRNVT